MGKIYRRMAVLLSSHNFASVEVQRSIFFRLFRIGRFWLERALSTFCSSFNLDIPIISLCILCLASMPWYTTMTTSTTCFTGFVRSVSVLWRLSRDLLRDPTSFLCSFFLLPPFHSIHWRYVFVVSFILNFAEFWRMGNQKNLRCCFGRLVVTSLLKYVVRFWSSSEIILRTALLCLLVWWTWTNLESPLQSREPVCFFESEGWFDCVDDCQWYFLVNWDSLWMEN